LLGGFEQGLREEKIGDKSIINKKFWEEIIAHVFLRHGPHRKPKIRGYTERHRDTQTARSSQKPPFIFPKQGK
jgi:hypothetical protein